MKNYLIITLGTSEVQVIESQLEANGFEIASDNKSVFRKEVSDQVLPIKENRNRKGTYLFDKPRLSGEFVLQQGLEKFMPIFDFPLVLPAIELFFKENPNQKIDKCLFVFTDQVDPKFRDNDTLHFKTILKEKLKAAFGLDEQVFMEFPIRENVTVIDFQYVDFAKRCKEILDTPEEEIQQVVLLTQGGIDQINQALTLQFIQAYKHKLKLYQKAEGRPPEVLIFPQLFLHDLNKQKIIKHLEDYDFDKALDLYLKDDWQKKLCQYATLRLSLSLDDAVEFTNTFSRADKKQMDAAFFEQLKIVPPKASKIEKNSVKLKDLVVVFTIFCHQKRYNDALIKLFTIFENLFKSQIETQLHLAKDLGDAYNPVLKSHETNEKWQAVLNDIDSSLLALLSGKGVWVNNPNRLAYFHIFVFLLQQKRVSCGLTAEQLETFGKLMEELSGKRNAIAHGLSSVSEAEIKIIISNSGYSLDLLISTLNNLVDEPAFGIFQEIQNKLLTANA